MPSFTHEELTLSYLDEGEKQGETVLLIHGFASNKRVNWVNPGWVKTLSETGFRVLAFDNRGHGESDKPHDANAYFPEKMASDAVALLNHLAIADAHIMGYSMGARIAAFVAIENPEMVKSVIFGGLGIGMVEGVGEWDPIVEALLAPSIDDVRHSQGREFRAFADQTKSDRLALAACIRSSRTLLTREQMAQMKVPALVAVGSKDEIAGSAAELANLMPSAHPFEIERRDHMLAVGDASFKKRVLSFLRDQE